MNLTQSVPIRIHCFQANRSSIAEEDGYAGGTALPVIKPKNGTLFRQTLHRNGRASNLPSRQVLLVDHIDRDAAAVRCGVAGSAAALV